MNTLNKGVEAKTEVQKELEIWELANHRAKNSSGYDDEAMAAGSAYLYFKIKKLIRRFRKDK